METKPQFCAGYRYSSWTFNFFRDNNSQNICIIRIEETQGFTLFWNLRILNVRVNEWCTGTLRLNKLQLNYRWGGGGVTITLYKLWNQNNKYWYNLLLLCYKSSVREYCHYISAVNYSLRQNQVLSISQCRLYRYVYTEDSKRDLRSELVREPLVHIFEFTW